MKVISKAENSEETGIQLIILNLSEQQRGRLADSYAHIRGLQMTYMPDLLHVTLVWPQVEIFESFIIDEIMEKDLDSFTKFGYIITNNIRLSTSIPRRAGICVVEISHTGFCWRAFPSGEQTSVNTKIITIQKLLEAR